MVSLSRLLNDSCSTRRRPAAPRFRPAVEVLEDRTVPSAVSSISSSFNGYAIPAGDTIWFNAAFKANNLGAAPVSVHVTNQTISFNAGGTSYNVSVPDSIVNFSSANTVATTGFDAGQNAWVTNLPLTWSGNAFLGGAGYVSNGLPGAVNLPLLGGLLGGVLTGINPVTWSGSFSADTPSVNLSWQWGAAVYTHFGSDGNALDVKPLDASSGTIYRNADHAGTPEAYKGYLSAGARGNGGSNWSGTYTSTASVTPAYDPSLNATASISGFVYDNTTSSPMPLANVLVTLTGTTASGQSITLTTTTAADGSYSFTNLQAGTYSLTDAPPSNYFDSATTAGTVGGSTDGSVPTPGTIASIVLAAGDTGIDYDFFDTNRGTPS